MSANSNPQGYYYPTDMYNPKNQHLLKAQQLTKHAQAHESASVPLRVFRQTTGVHVEHRNLDRQQAALGGGAVFAAGNAGGGAIAGEAIAALGEIAITCGGAAVGDDARSCGRCISLADSV